MQQLGLFSYSFHYRDNVVITLAPVYRFVVLYLIFSFLCLSSFIYSLTPETMETFQTQRVEGFSVPTLWSSEGFTVHKATVKSPQEWLIHHACSPGISLYFHVCPTKAVSMVSSKLSVILVNLLESHRSLISKIIIIVKKVFSNQERQRE